MHAVFGEPSGVGELKVANEAHLIRRILPSDMVAIQNKLSERGKELLAKVTSAIWPHYICPYMEKAPLTAEADIFTKLLQSDRYAAVMQQCRLRYTANVYSQGRKDFAKKILLRDARSFFLADEGVKKFWSLVVQHKRAQGGLANWESFDVLFTDGAVADERRYDFLNDCCEDAELSPLVGLLRHVLDVYVEQLLSHIDTVDGLIERISFAVTAFSSVAISTGPPSHFESMIWPCFVDALCDLQYYFSIDEVLLICMAARVSVIVFTAQGDEFAYAGASTADSDGNAVVPIVLDYATETLRGHFSRLLQNDVSWFINSPVQVTRKIWNTGISSETTIPGISSETTETREPRVRRPG